MIGQSSELQSGTVYTALGIVGFSSFRQTCHKSLFSESKKVGWKSTTQTSQADFSLIDASANWQRIEGAEVRWLASTVADA